ncbi:MAG: hypothetical protein M3O70_18690, partial [Actinomycetota bacterium]|nr:hypothetical protein [Actinomycetota bacterium]
RGVGVTWQVRRGAKASIASVIVLVRWASDMRRCRLSMWQPKESEGGTWLREHRAELVEFLMSAAPRAAIRSGPSHIRTHDLLLSSPQLQLSNAARDPATPNGRLVVTNDFLGKLRHYAHLTRQRHNSVRI